MRTIRPARAWRMAVAAGFLLAAVGATGQIAVPLYVGNLVPVLDPYGQPMPGTYDSDPSERARVEVRVAATGAVYPPDTNGTAHAFNPLLSPDSVGGIGQNAGSPGLFAMVFPLRPVTGTRLFGRVFNRPTVEAATFYADSTAGMVTASGVSMVLVFGAAQPLDSGDDDGDGLINSWEKELGTDDRLTWDYDDDGYGDLDEHLAGTDPADASSLLEFNLIARETGSVMRVRFQTVPGRKYQLEEAPTLLSPQEFTPVGDVLTATNGQYEAEILAPVADESIAGKYRVRTMP